MARTSLQGSNWPTLTYGSIFPSGSRRPRCGEQRQGSPARLQRQREEITVKSFPATSERLKLAVKSLLAENKIHRPIRDRHI